DADDHGWALRLPVAPAVELDRLRHRWSSAARRSANYRGKFSRAPASRVQRLKLEHRDTSAIDQLSRGSLSAVGSEAASSARFAALSCCRCSFSSFLAFLARSRSARS